MQNFKLKKLRFRVKELNNATATGEQGAILVCYIERDVFTNVSIDVITIFKI